MKILWVTKLTDCDPFKNTQIGLSEALRKRGHVVQLIMAKNVSEKKTNTLEKIYVPTIQCSIVSGIVFGMLIFFYLPILVKKEKIDIIFVDGDSIWSPFFLILKLYDTPVVWDIRSLPIDKERSILHDISLYLSKYIIDEFTTITPELSEILVERYKLKDKKIGIWSSAVSRDIFLKKDGDEINIRDSYPNIFIVLYHGTYSPTRGIEDLIRSLSEIDLAVREKIRLLIVGISTIKRDELLRLCEDLKIDRYVEIIPPVEIKKIPSYIRGAHIGVIPLPPKNIWWRVSVPLKTLEYLAMGKPILATNIPFHQKLFDMCECGLLVNSNNPKDLANGIISLYHNRDKLDEMGKRGKEMVEKFYTWDHQALILEKFFQTILESN
jgi:glycosyltransferase involved in cell wall biosynthesis